MAAAENFWVDGEKIPDSRLKEVFQTPPEATSPFLRSTLVIGARGAGKTTLFRHLKESHTGVGVHLSLAAALGCIHKETGLGPLAKDCPTHLQQSLPGKTISLLAVALAEKLIRKGVNVPLEMLLECLPPALRAQTKTLDAGGVSEIQRQIAGSSVSSFDGLANGRSLSDFVPACGRASGLAGGPLLVLLDRADQVNAQWLLPVFELLDQSSDYMALVAMRPGHTNHAIEHIAGHVVPGDHYDVTHLGIQPSSPAWHTFVEGSVRAQAELLGLIDQFRGIPDDVRRWITIISRDCVRTALELYARYLSAKPSAAETELVKAIEDAKERMLIGAQASLQKFTSEFLLRASRWEKVQVSFRDISSLDAAVEREIVAAKQKSAPVILLPNGPKSLVFFTALKLCTEYPNASWFVYPVPAGYDVNYSEGTAGISWFARNCYP